LLAGARAWSPVVEGADPTAFGDGAVSPIATGESRPRRRPPDRKDSIANNLRPQTWLKDVTQRAEPQGSPLRGTATLFCDIFNILNF
jgi:hypothetical protein